MRAIFDPSPDQWPGLVRDVPTNATSIETRRMLGLPIDRPIIMAGHQAELWHPGILSKWFAAIALAVRTDAAPAWVVVDQDATDSMAVRSPSRDDAGKLSERTHRFARPPRSADTPSKQRPATEPSDAGPENPALPSVAEGIAAARQALAAASSARTQAEQLARATARLLRAHSPADADGYPITPAMIFATSLSTTPAFAELLQAMRTDPDACADAYNAAASAHPDAHIRELTTAPGSDRELPLWRIGSTRRAVFASELADIDIAELAPRALAMTALLRMHACDLFIHGTGGGASGTIAGYDRITEQWITNWLGKDAKLAPSVVATATLQLPLSREPVPTERDVAEARARAHRARHQPSLVGDDQAEAHKRELVAAIEAAPYKSAERSAAFQQMHAGLAEVRSRHDAELHRLDAHAADIAARYEARSIIEDRTWPFVLFEDTAIAELRNEIYEALR
ncbi:MAG: hypothetical protein AAF747_04165 [Planctomycetota bacterium]